MKYTIYYMERALQEYEAAVGWYILQSEQAAINFETEFNRSLSLLKDIPGSFRRSYKRFHEISLKKYPFNIVYTVNESKRMVTIISVFHHKRNPKKKFKD